MSKESLEKTILDIERSVKDNLMEVQKTCDPRDMARVNPEKWAELAIRLLNGSTGLQIRKELGCAYSTIKKVEGQISAELGQLADQKIQEVRVLTNQNDELMQQHYENLANKAANGESFTDEDSRIAKNLADAGTKLHFRSDRLEGRADIITETRVVSDDDLQQTADAARARLRMRQGAIDVELEEEV